MPLRVFMERCRNLIGFKVAFDHVLVSLAALCQNKTHTSEILHVRPSKIISSRLNSVAWTRTKVVQWR